MVERHFEKVGDEVVQVYEVSLANADYDEIETVRGIVESDFDRLLPQAYESDRAKYEAAYLFDGDLGFYLPREGMSDEEIIDWLNAHYGDEFMVYS